MLSFCCRELQSELLCGLILRKLILDVISSQLIAYKTFICGESPPVVAQLVDYVFERKPKSRGQLRSWSHFVVFPCNHLNLHVRTARTTNKHTHKKTVKEFVPPIALYLILLNAYFHPVRPEGSPGDQMGKVGHLSPAI